MAVFRSTPTQVSNIDRLLAIVNSPFFVAIGKPNPWSAPDGIGVNDLNPPLPSKAIKLLPDHLLFKSPIYQTLAIDTSCGGVDFDSCGTSQGRKVVTLIDLSTTPREALEDINPPYVFFKVEITDNDLLFGAIDTFRTIGLYKGTTFNSPGQIRYLPSAVTSLGKLYWVSYATPVQRVASLNKTFTLEILLTL